MYIPYHSTLYIEKKIVSSTFSNWSSRKKIEGTNKVLVFFMHIK